MTLAEQLCLLRLLGVFCEEYEQTPGALPTTIDDIADMIVRDMREAAPRRPTTQYVMQMAEGRAAAITRAARKAYGSVRD